METPLIAVMTKRNIGFIIAIFGILKSGAAYVPVDPAFPPDRQSYMFSHSQCQLLIADKESFSFAKGLGAELPSEYIIIDSSTGAIEEFRKLKPFYLSPLENELVYKPDLTNEDKLAYVLYTSGSTGKPKGVMVKEAGVVNIVT